MATATTTTSRCLADIPNEIQSMLPRLLPYSDYFSCALVCRTWNLIFTPHIWRTIKPQFYIHFKPGDSTFHSRFSNSVCQHSALRKNGHLVHSFRVDFGHLYMRAILDHSPAALPFLTFIELADFRNDYVLADLLSRATSGLKILVLHDYDRLLVAGPKTAEVLVRLHAPTLEILRIGSLRRFPSKCIQGLLMNAPRLKELYLLPYAQTANGMDEGFLDASDVGPFDAGDEQAGWACTGLEIFACQIGGIPRPDIVLDPDTTATANDNLGASKKVLPGTPDQSLALQHRVYTQLGRLTRLKRLLLNVPHDPSRGRTQKDCLAMTLESGLGLLGEMKQLRELGVKGMEVGIRRKKEKEWVDEHWPHVVFKEK